MEKIFAFSKISFSSRVKKYINNNRYTDSNKKYHNNLKRSDVQIIENICYNESVQKGL